MPHEVADSSTDNLLSSPKKRVRLDDVSPSSFQYLVRLFYATQPPLTPSIVAGVIYLAQKYLLTHLYAVCVAYISDLAEQCDPVFLQVIADVYRYGLKDESLDMAYSRTF